MIPNISLGPDEPGRGKSKRECGCSSTIGVEKLVGREGESMKSVVIYFSQTGNTKKVAEAIQREIKSPPGRGTF